MPSLNMGNLVDEGVVGLVRRRPGIYVGLMVFTPQIKDFSWLSLDGLFLQ